MQLRFSRGGIGLEPAKLAAVAAQSQHSVRAERAAMRNEARARSRKEIRLAELRKLKAESGVRKRDASLD